MGSGRPEGRGRQRDPCSSVSDQDWDSESFTGIFTSALMPKAAPGLDTFSSVPLSRWSVSSANTASPANVLFPLYSLLFENASLTPITCVLLLNTASSTTTRQEV